MATKYTTSCPDEFIYLFIFSVVVIFVEKLFGAASLKMAANFFDPNNNRERQQRKKNPTGVSVKRMKWKLCWTWTLAANGKSGAATIFFFGFENSPKIKCLFACGMANEQSKVSLYFRDSLKKNENAIMWFVNRGFLVNSNTKCCTAIIII